MTVYIVGMLAACPSWCFTWWLSRQLAKEQAESRRLLAALLWKENEPAAAQAVAEPELSDRIQKAKSPFQSTDGHKPLGL